MASDAARMVECAMILHRVWTAPFVLIAGGEDAEAGAVSFRFRDGAQDNGVPVDDAVARVVEAVRSRVQV